MIDFWQQLWKSYEAILDIEFSLLHLTLTFRTKQKWQESLSKKCLPKKQAKKEVWRKRGQEPFFSRRFKDKTGRAKKISAIRR